MQDPRTLEQNPGLADLIADLHTRFITPTGLSVDLDKELHQAQYSLQHKKSYLETLTIYESVERLRFLPLDNHHGGGDITLSHRDADLQRQLAAHVDRIISLLETRRLQLASNITTSSLSEGLLGSGHRHGTSAHSPKLPAKETTTSVMEILASQGQGLEANKDVEMALDLDGFTLEQLWPHLNALEGFGGPMTETIDKAIQQRAQDVIALFNNSNRANLFPDCSSSRNKNAQPLISLAEVVSHARRRFAFLDRAKESVTSHDLVLQLKAQELFETLHKSIVVLWEVLVEVLITYQLEKDDKTFREYFHQMVESAVLKLEILRASVQESVYDKDTVAELVQVRDALDQKQQSLASQTQQNAALLHQYQNAGPEFNMIVDAYSEVMRRIEIVQDDIRRLE